MFNPLLGNSTPNRPQRLHDWVPFIVREQVMDPPILVTVPGGRMSEEEAEQAVLDLVRAMGEGDILKG